MVGLDVTVAIALYLVLIINMQLKAMLTNEIIKKTAFQKLLLHVVILLFIKMIFCF